MAWCLLAPSHYPNQCWSSEVFCDIHLRAISEVLINLISTMYTEITLLKISITYIRDQWVKDPCKHTVICQNWDGIGFGPHAILIQWNLNYLPSYIWVISVSLSLFEACWVQGYFGKVCISSSIVLASNVSRLGDFGHPGLPWWPDSKGLPPFYDCDCSVMSYL